jgi:hypothetical protein
MKYVIIGLVTFIAGYLIGSYFPVRGFFSSSESISGNAQLKVTVLRPDNSPATNLEVDISTEAGRVLNGGHEKTDSNGIATFNVQPGNYYIFFNAINFPKGLFYTDVPPVTLQSGKTASQTIILREQK